MRRSALVRIELEKENPPSLRIDLRIDHDRIIRSNLISFFEQNDAESLISRKLLTFIVGVPNSRSQIEKWIRFLYVLQEKQAVPTLFNFLQHIRYIFCDDVIKTPPLNAKTPDFFDKGDERTKNVQVIVDDIMRTYEPLIKAIEKLQSIAGRLSDKFSDAARNKKGSFTTDDCKVAFLACVVKIAVKFELSGDRLKEYLQYAKTCDIAARYGYTLLNSSKMPRKIQQYFSKTINFLNCAIEKVNLSRELLLVKYTEELNWSKFTFISLGNLLNRIGVESEPYQELDASMNDSLQINNAIT